MLVFRFGFRFSLRLDLVIHSGLVLTKLCCYTLTLKIKVWLPNYTNLLNIHWLMCYIYYIVYDAGVSICV